MSHGSGRKSSGQTGDPFWRRTAKDLLVDCVGRGRKQRTNNFQGFGLMSRQWGHLLTWVGLEEKQVSWVKQELCL